MTEESACQRDNLSCGSCCGIFNLKLNKSEEIKSILYDRGVEFIRVRMDEPSTIVNYREIRENLESTISRKNKEIYVCPFLGFLDGSEKIGCLIHPGRTGNPLSQNFSFYGASICQDYDCPNKEADFDNSYGNFVAKYFDDIFLYSRLMADTIFYRILTRIPGWPGILDSSLRIRDAFVYLIKLRLCTVESRYITSFEIQTQPCRTVRDEILKCVIPDPIGQEDTESFNYDSLNRAIQVILDTNATESKFTHDLESASDQSSKALYSETL